MDDKFPAAAPALMWAITMPCGRRGKRWIYAFSLSHTRAAAIREHVETCGKSWAELRRQGDRCVRVLVAEVRQDG
jgi:hypothetical protein